MRQKINLFLNGVCWPCVAKAGLALGIVSIFLSYRNIYVPIGAIIFNLAALMNMKRENEQSKRDLVKVLASIGLTLGVLFLIKTVFSI